jgi:hypothetical protein
MGPSGSEAVRAIFVQFDQRTQRRRSILRLALVAIMVLPVFSGTSRSEWPAQIVLVATHGALSVIAIKTHIRRLYEKLGVSDRGAAVAQAMRNHCWSDVPRSSIWMTPGSSSGSCERTLPLGCPEPQADSYDNNHSHHPHLPFNQTCFTRTERQARHPFNDDEVRRRDDRNPVPGLHDRHRRSKR